MGLDIPKLTKLGQDTHMAVGTIQQYFDEFTDHLYQTWGPSLNKSLNGLSDWFKVHTPEINGFLDNLHTHFDQVTTSTTNWYKALSPEGQTAVQGAGLVGAVLAWKSILGFIEAIPGVGPMAAKVLGISSLGVAIAGLASDYMTWKQTGGKDSLIDWSRWDSAIQSATKAVKSFNETVIFPLTDKLGIDQAFIPAFEGLAAFLAGSRLKGPIGWLLKALALIPGSGVGTAALAALGITYEVNKSNNETMYDNASKLGFDKQGGGLTDPIPTFHNPKTGETLTYGQMRERLGGEKDSSNPIANFFTKMWNGTSWTGGGDSGADMGSPGFGSDGGGAIGRGGPGGGAALQQYGVMGGKGDETPPAPMGAHMAVKANELMQSLVKQFGISPAQAAGIVSNWVSESGLDPAAENQTSGAIGLMQWLGPRKAALIEYAKSQGKGWWDLQTQLSFWAKEFAPSGTESRAGAELSAAQTPEEAAQAGYDSERPGPTDHTFGRRVANAMTMFRNYNPAGIGAANQPAMTGPISPSPASYHGGTVDNSKTVTVNAPTSVKIDGVSDPARAADMVDRSTRREAANLIHQVRTIYA